MVRYPQGVKLIVLSFKDQFGTSEGTMLREWAIHYKWGLAWTLHDDSVCEDPRRLLDPYVLVCPNPFISPAWLRMLESTLICVAINRLNAGPNDLEYHRCTCASHGV